MLTINKTYCISSEEGGSATSIQLNKENGFYNFFITNFNGDQINIQLNETLASELFTSLKELGNFV